MTAIARRASSKLIKLLDRAAAPVAALRVPFYSLLGDLYVRSGSGIINKMTGTNAVTPTGWIDGGKLTWTSVTQVTIAAALARDSSDVIDLLLAGSQVVDITVSGANGLDTGAEAADTWYAVYLIGDTTRVQPVAGILSASFVAPTLPAGYDVYRRIGVVRNNAGSNFLKFYQTNPGFMRRYFWDESQATVQVLTNGNAIVATAVSLGALMPPTALAGVFNVAMRADSVGGAAADELSLKPTGAVNFTHLFRPGLVGAAGADVKVWAELPVSSGQQIDYAVTDADDQANLWLLGFDDEI